MTVINSRESMLSHESKEYIESRPKWVFGRIPDLSDYRKLSVDSMEEAFLLARLGQEMVSAFFPSYHKKPLYLSFTQAMLVGAGLLTREQAEKAGLDFEKYRSVLMVTPTRYGKQITYACPVLTPSGWRKHGELKVGDYVYHPSGKPVKILATMSWQPDNYRVYFRNGEIIDCHANHEWTVWDRKKTYSHRESGKRVIDKRGDYVTIETKEMLEHKLSDGHSHYRFLVDAPKPCQFEEKDQPLQPYFVGCWLGDGTKNKPVITLSSKKAEKILPHIRYKVTGGYDNGGDSRAYEFTHQNILQDLRGLNLYENKHIPSIYKYASFEQQKQLLAGIIDTDGYADKSGRVIISCANDKLKDDIFDLLTVMGLSPYVSSVPPAISSSGIVGKHTVHQIGFQPTYELPTHRVKINRIVSHNRIAITKIEKLDYQEEGQCIQVDSPDGLYLVGKQLIPTHNSFLNGILAIIKAGAEGKEVRIGGATKDKAGIIQEKIVSLLPDTSKPLQDGLIVTEEDGDINKKVARMSTQVSREALAWRNGGSIKSFSTNENRKNVDVAAAGAIGIGGDFVILDEIQLMTPVGFNTASRFMMENPDTKRFCVGNPQISGHFKDLYDDPTTFVVHINDIGAIVEGRMSRRGMELTGMPSYSPEYRAFIMVEFPDENSGTRFFPTLPLPASKANLPEPVNKVWFMGIDSAYKGGDALMVTLLSYNEAEDKKWIMVESQVDLKKKYEVWTDDTTTNIALDILKLIQDYNIQYTCLDIGLGIHIYEALTRLDPDLPIEPVNFSQKPTEWRQESDYNAKVAANARAEMHLDLRDLSENGLIYINGDNYDEILRQMREIGSKSDAVNSKIRVEPKEDIKKRLGRSPDNLDSLCLAIRAMVMSGLLAGQADVDGDVDYAEFF